ncbi:MAG: sensor histidine kinase, partial [Coprobacillaceae bacterium]
MKNKNIRFKLTSITASIILSFIIVTTLLFALFFTYFSHIIEKTYGIDDDILAPFYSIIIIAMIVLIIFALILSIIGGSFVSEHFLKTVREFTEKIKIIKDGGKEQRLPITNNDELDALGREFNLLMDDISSSMDKQNQFVLDASHELKTPLAIINGNCDMLLRWGKDDSEILMSSLIICKEETNRMITLTNELLQLTRVFDSSKVSPLLNMDLEIERVVAEFHKLYPTFDITFTYDKGKDVRINPEHFNQIIIILLDNAIKYARLDSKRIEISHHGYILEVKDYGIGIDKENIEKIFDRFYRADEARENRENSFGLGLSILKKFGEWYKFKITVESEKSEYTNFIIEF